MPDGCVDLIWRDGRIELAGPDTGAWISGLEPGSALVGVRARPGMARLLTGVPAGEVRDRRVDAAEVWGARARALGERIADDPARAGLLLEGFVRERLGDFAPDPVVAAAVRGLDDPRPPSMAGLADGIGVSERQLRRRIGDAVGYGPSTLVRVLRFQRAVGLGRGVTGLAELAHGCGYADQAHLTREFRHLSGLTPRHYFRRDQAAS